jgi:N-acetylglucosaminyldiphosphoundecaprenol N-acetyl-beta-D-mannosaminyltransferase
MNMNSAFVSVTGAPVSTLTFDDQMQLIMSWAKTHVSKVVCVANVHMIMEAHWHPDFNSVLERADLVTPDGMPLVWMIKMLGAYNPSRVAGMDILLYLCKSAPEQNVSVFFLGSQEEILNRMGEKLGRDFPNLKIAGMQPLPFRPLNPEEDEAIIQGINNSGASIVFVSLGCPKQEFWMTQHKDKIQAVMIGLGGAFPVYAGIHKRAPRLVRDCGLEWLYRLLQEPRRLWGRYSKTIPPFIYLAAKQLLTQSKLQQVQE